MSIKTDIHGNDMPDGGYTDEYPEIHEGCFLPFDIAKNKTSDSHNRAEGTTDSNKFGVVPMKA